MRRISILLLAIGGCGEDGATGPGLRVWQCDGVRVKGPLDVGLPPAARGNIEFAQRGASACQGWAIVLTSDGSSGFVSRVDLSTFRIEPELFATNPDAVARHINGRLYVLNRSGDESIQVYDTTDSNFVQVGSPFPIGDGSANPQDICCASREQCFVTRLGDPGVLMINPETGEEIGTIDLSDLDVDGNPDASACFLGGSKLAVALRRLDGSAPRDPGGIAIIDLLTDPPSLAYTMDTAAPNPLGRFRRQDDTVARIAEAGSIGATDGVLEVVDVRDGTSLGVLLTEDELGGDLMGFDTCVSGETWAIAEDADGISSLHAIDLPLGGHPGHARPSIIEGENHRLTSIAAEPCQQRLWVADRNVPAE